MRLGFAVFIGLPGSGKTTLAKALIRNSQNGNGDSYQFIHICYDELLQVQNGNYELEYKLARNSVLGLVERLVVAIKNKNISLSPEFEHQLKCINWESDIVLILDDNMYFKSMRYSLFQIARKHNIGFCQVYLKCSLETALVRNNSRKPEFVVPVHIIENMASKIEPPNLKNNWEKYSVELDAHKHQDEVLCEIFPVLNESLSNCLHETETDDTKELSKIQCQKSVLHQTDLALRKIIGFKMKKYFSDNHKEKCKEYITNLNARKSEILSDVKLGNICLPEAVLEDIDSDTTEKFILINFLDSYF